MRARERSARTLQSVSALFPKRDQRDQRGEATSAAKRHVRSAIERAANLDFNGIVRMNTDYKSHAVDACQHELTIKETGFIADIDACPQSQRPILDSGCLHPPRRDVPRRVGRRRLFPFHETHAIDQLQLATATFSGASVSVPLSSSPAIRSASADAAMPSCEMSVARVTSVGGDRTTTRIARRRLPHHETSCNHAFVGDHPSARRARGGWCGQFLTSMRRDDGHVQRQNPGVCHGAPPRVGHR